MSQEGKVWMLFNMLTQKRSEALTKSEMQMALFSMKIKEIENIYIWTAGWATWQPLKEFLSSDQKHFIGYNPNSKIKAIDENSVPEFSLSSTEITQKVDLDRFKDTSPGANFHVRGETQTDIPEMKDITPIKETRKNSENKSERSQSSKKKNNNAYHDKTFTQLVANDEFLKDAKGKNDFYRNDASGDELSEKNISNDNIAEINRRTSRSFVSRSERHAFKIEVIIFFPNGKSLKSYSRNISLTGTLIEDNIPYEQNGKPFDIVIVNRFENDPRRARMTMKAIAVGEGVTRRLQFRELNDAQIDKLHNLLSAYIEKEKELKAA